MDEKYASMSKGYKRITDFIRENLEQAAFMTAKEIGKSAQTSESTVVRYASFMGFPGFPEFSQVLSETFKGQVDSFSRIKNAYGSSSKSEIINGIMASDMEQIALTMKFTDVPAFEAAISLISEAKRIFVIGVRQEAPLAAFLAFYLNLIYGNAVLVQTTAINEIFEQLLSLTSEDLVIGISFPGYSMRTIKALEFAKSRCTRVISITDRETSPVNMYSNVPLLAKCGTVSIVDSLVAPLSLINALVVALCVKDQKRISDNLHLIEQLWDDYQVNGRDELNVADDEKIIRLSEKE